MSTVNTTVRIDVDLKRQAEALLGDLGMSLSTAFNIFLRQTVREQRIPFVIGREVPNATTMAAIKAAEDESEIFGPYDSVSDMMEALDA